MHSTNTNTLIYSTHVLTKGTISKEEVKNGKLYSKWLLTKTIYRRNWLHKWGERFISKNIIKIVEEIIVDPEAKTVISYTRNLGYIKVMVNELFILLEKKKLL